MGIKDLPAGRKFTTVGPRSFQRKLKIAALHGALTNLDKKNQEALAKGLIPYGRAIRIGEFSRLRQLSAWRKIKASDKTITKEDKRDIKEMLKHLGSGAATVQGKTAVARKAVKTGDARSYLTEKQIARNLNYARRQRINESGAMDRGSISEQYGGGKVESHGVMQQHGTMENIGVSWNRKNGDKLGGFAAENLGSKLPNNPAPPQAPSTGIRPLGL